MTRLTKRSRLLALLVSTALAATVLVASPQASATMSSPFLCVFQGIPANTGPLTITDTPVAPATVDPGATFSVVYVPSPWAASGPGSPASINSLTGVSVTLAKLPFATYTATNTPGVTQTVNGDGSLTIAYGGTFTPGGIPASFTFPAFTVTMTAVGSGGGGQKVEPTVASAAVASASISSGGANLEGPLSCTPTGSGVLSSTVIKDLEKPSIVIDSPNSSSYELGTPLLSKFTCADPSGCTTQGRYRVNGGGWTNVASNQPLPTGTLNAVVDVEAWAIDNSPQHNQSTTATASYTVLPPIGDNIVPTGTLTFTITGSPLPDPLIFTQGAPMPTVFYSCADPGGGIASCTLNPNVASGQKINGATAGVFIYTLTAVDTAGNSTKVSRTVRILPAPVQSNFTDPGIAGSPGGTNSVAFRCNPIGLGFPLELKNFDDFNWTVPFTFTPGGLPSVANSPLTVRNPDPSFVSWDVRMSTMSMPLSIDGHDVTDVRFAGIYYPKPTNATWDSVTLLDSGVSVASPSASVTSYAYGGPAHIYVSTPNVLATPGPFALPGVRMRAKVDAGVGAGSTVSLVGPDHFNFEIDVKYKVVWTTQIGTIHVNCDRITPPVMATTTLINRMPPTATITSPTNGQLIAPGASVPFTYSCQGNPTPITQTVATPNVANGTPVDTSTSGPVTLTVRCVDAEGNMAETSVTYVVLPPTASATNCSAFEGNPCTFKVKLSSKSSRVVKVRYQTTPDSATGGGVDYSNATGVLTFQPGDTEETVPVNTIDDAVIEGNEQFKLELLPVMNGTTNVSNAYMSQTPGIGFIVNGTWDCSFVWPGQSVGLLDAALQWWKDHTGNPNLTYASLANLGIAQWQADGSPSFDPAIWQNPGDDPNDVTITFAFSQAQYAAIVVPLMQSMGLDPVDGWCGAAFFAGVYYAVIYALTHFKPGEPSDSRMLLDGDGRIGREVLDSLLREAEAIRNGEVRGGSAGDGSVGGSSPLTTVLSGGGLDGGARR